MGAATDVREVALPAESPPAGVYESVVMRKVAVRLLPFLFLLFAVNILDRGNIGMARLQLVDRDHILSDSAFGIGAGIFYLGYLLFEVPSNMILARTGARAWIARILVSWGIVSSCTLFVSGAASFFTLRVLLGITEAGFFPGIIYYMGHWFPARARARAIAVRPRPSSWPVLREPQSRISTRSERRKV